MIGVSINILNKSHLALLAQPLADLTQQFHNWELLLKCYPSGDSIPFIICNIMQNLCGKCIESNNIVNKSRLWLILPINPLGMTEDGQIIRHSYLKSVFYHTKSFTCKRLTYRPILSVLPLYVIWKISWPPIWQIYIMFTHFKLWIAWARHSFQWVNIWTRKP